MEEPPRFSASFRAELISLGGAIVLTVCLLVTALFLIALFAPEVTRVQRAIATVLFFGSWAYLFRSVSERLVCVDGCVIYRAALTKPREIRIQELETVILVDEGFNLDRGSHTLELHRVDARVERISLGPCWSKTDLDDFLRAVQKTLNA